MNQIKRISVILTLLAGLLIYGYLDLLSYAVGQGIGQLSVVWNARPIDEILADPLAPDSLKAQLRFIGEVRRYAIDSLGLNDTENYSSLYDQQGKEIMWVVTACEPWNLKEKTWDFPIVGKVPYKGFFSPEKAKAEATLWKQQGLDVSIRNPGGWSTLGWFTDPVLSGMLSRSKGDLASLIIHEMSHATIYVKDSSTFNENLASFIGDEGAKKFLASKYGPGSRELNEFVREDLDYRTWVDHMLRGSEILDSLYQDATFIRSADSVKQRLKTGVISQIVSRTDTLTLPTITGAGRYFKNELPNNAYFMSFIRYRALQTDFSGQWKEKFKGDILEMIRYYREHFPFL
ncbi:MAG: aminopeptidase [Cyclobacteriaceae bacterium]